MPTHEPWRSGRLTPEERERMEEMADWALVSRDPIPPEDLERAREFVREQGWVHTRPEGGQRD